MFSFQLFPWKKRAILWVKILMVFFKAGGNMFTQAKRQINRPVSWHAKPKCIFIFGLDYLDVNLQHLFVPKHPVFMFPHHWLWRTGGENLNGQCVTKSTAVSPFPAAADSPLEKLNFLWAALWSPPTPPPPRSFFALSFSFFLILQ